MLKSICGNCGKPLENMSHMVTNGTLSFCDNICRLAYKKKNPEVRQPITVDQSSTQEKRDIKLTVIRRIAQGIGTFFALIVGGVTIEVMLKSYDATNMGKPLLLLSSLVLISGFILAWFRRHEGKAALIIIFGAVFLAVGNMISSHNHEGLEMLVLTLPALLIVVCRLMEKSKYSE